MFVGVAQNGLLSLNVKATKCARLLLTELTWGANPFNHTPQYKAEDHESNNAQCDEKDLIHTNTITGSTPIAA
jgi:hypothetical protein